MPGRPTSRRGPAAQLYLNYLRWLSLGVGIVSGIVVLLSSGLTPEGILLALLLALFIPVGVTYMSLRSKYQALAAGLEVVTETDVPLSPSDKHTEEVSCGAGQMFLIQAASSHRFKVVAHLHMDGDRTTVIRPTEVYEITQRITAPGQGRLTIVTDAGRPSSGMIHNEGQIFLTNAGSTMELAIDDEVLLFGNGSITLGGTSSTASRIIDLSGGNGNLINAGNTIEGFGAIGVNSMQITNQAGGVIDANILDKTLTVDPNGLGAFNEGIFQASNGGILVLTSGDFDNSGGIIEALDMSTVSLTGSAVVLGGTIQNSGSGSVQIPVSNVATLTDITNASELNQLNNANMVLVGTINNLGSIVVTNTGSTTDIQVNSAVSLEGGGTITLAGTNTNSRLLDATGSDGVLTNVDNTIEGHGNIGVNSLMIVNQAQGLIDANSTSGTLTVNPPTGSNLVNMGTMRASGGGTLILTSGDFDNSGGMIQALASSQLSITGSATVDGGTLDTSGDGVIVIPLSNVASISNLILDGTLNQLNNANLNIGDAITVNGDINVNSTGSTTDILVVDDPLIVTGTGAINLTGVNSRILPIGDGNLMLMGLTLGGIGNVMAEIELISATVAPGNSIGILRFSGPAAINSNSTFEIEIDAANGVEGINWDLIDSSDELNLQQSGGSELVVQLNTLDDMGDPGPLADFDPAEDYVFMIAIADTISNYSPSNFSFDLTGFSNVFTGEFSIAKGPFGVNEALYVKYGQFKLGDVNQDGNVNLLDVQPFVAAISAGLFITEADINCDGQVNLLDVTPFVVLLSG